MSTKTNYLITREGNLIALSDDELMHYKYIKREKVNGKWRYYYHDDDLEKAKQARNAAARQHIAAKSAYKTADANRDVANEKYKEVQKSAKIPSRFDKIFRPNKVKENAQDYSERYRKAYADVKKAYSKASEASRNVRTTGSAYSQASAKYQLAQKRVNNSFGKKVADFLNKSSAKIDKAKKWFKSRR